METPICPDLETTRLLLRKLSPDDTDALFKVFSDEKTTLHVPRERHDDRSVTAEYIRNLIHGMSEAKSLVWAVVDKQDDRVIGTVSLFFKPDRVALIGAVLHSGYWGKGFATEALRAVIRFGFDELALIRMEGKCESSNTASEKVMQKLGMTYEGTLRKEVIIRGVSRDARIYSLLIDEYRA